MLTVILGLIFAVWLAVSVYIQLPIDKLRDRTSSPDIIRHLLPRWHFFSPKTIQADFEVQYRFGSTVEALEAANWRVLPGIGHRHTSQLVIYPGRRRKHVLFECCSAIVAGRDRYAETPSIIMLTAPYLLLLGYVSAACAHLDAQFRIMVIPVVPNPPLSAGEIYRSAVHRTRRLESTTLPGIDDNGRNQRN